jgi:hypothetical protein
LTSRLENQTWSNTVSISTTAHGVLPWSDSSIAERHGRRISRSQSNLMHNKKHRQPYATSIGYDMIVDIPPHHVICSHTSCLPPTSLE